jgi:hypothetical protein
MRIVIAVFASIPLVAFACSDATNGTPRTNVNDDAATGPGAEGGSSSSSSSSSGSSGNPGDAGGHDDAPVSTPNGIIINEISGKGANWVELYNGATAPADLAGWSLADSEKDGGAPKTSEAVVFPSGTTLAAGAYVLVAQIPADAGADAAPTCRAGGQALCFGATWGISNKTGETIYLLDKSGAVSTDGKYPGNTVGSGQTWGRLPNATGDFAINAPTPGAANHAP